MVAFGLRGEGTTSVTDDARPEDQLIGEAVRTARGDRTQPEIAEGMSARGRKWSAMTVSKVEKGERSLKLGEAQDLAAVLGVHLTRLLERPDTTEHRRELSAADRGVRQAHTAVMRAAEDLLEALDMLSAMVGRARSQKDPELKRSIELAVSSLDLTPEHAAKSARLAHGAETGA